MEIDPRFLDDDPDLMPVEGLDRATLKLKREYEAQVERKVSSDHWHIIAAYGLIWALFAGYGAFLLWRQRALRAALLRARGA